MPHGGSSRRNFASPGMATVLVAVVVVGFLGCQRPALRPWEERGRAITPARDVSIPSNDPPSLPPLPAAAKDGSAASEVASSSRRSAASATPLLDKALARAEALELRDEAPTTPAALRAPAMDHQPPEHGNGTEAGDPQPPAADPLPDFSRIELPNEPASLPATPPTTNPTPVSEHEAAAETPRPLPPRTWNGLLEELRSFTERELRESQGSESVWRIRGALIDWLGGEKNDDAWAATIPVLALPDEDPAARARAIRKAVDALEASGPLVIDVLKLCQRVHGFGHYESIEPTALRAGQVVIVYCEMSGLRYRESPEGFRSRLASRVELRSRDGGKSVWADELGTAEDVCAHRRRDFYVNYRVTLPTTLAPGEYDLVLLQNDLTGDRDATGKLPVAVVADPGSAPAVAANASSATAH